jgi:hypothetical protein
MNTPLVQKTQYYLNESHRLNEAINEEREYTSFLEEEIIKILEESFVGPQGGIEAGMYSQDPKQRLKAQIAQRHLPKLLKITAAHNLSLRPGGNTLGMSQNERQTKGKRIAAALRNTGSLNVGVSTEKQTDPKGSGTYDAGRVYGIGKKEGQELKVDHSINPANARIEADQETIAQRGIAARTFGRQRNDFVPAKKPGLLQRFKNYISQRLTNTASV